MSRRRISGPETDEVSRGLFTVRRERRRSKDFGGSGTREMARNPAAAPGAERSPRTLRRGGGWPCAARRAGRSKVLAATARKGTSLHGTTRLGLELEFTTPRSMARDDSGRILSTLAAVGAAAGLIELGDLETIEEPTLTGASTRNDAVIIVSTSTRPGGAGRAAVPLLRPSAPRTRSHAGDVRGQRSIPRQLPLLRETQSDCPAAGPDLYARRVHVHWTLQLGIWEKNPGGLVSAQVRR
jgi:hypothetical protein